MSLRKVCPLGDQLISELASEGIKCLDYWPLSLRSAASTHGGLVTSQRSLSLGTLITESHSRLVFPGWKCLCSTLLLFRCVQMRSCNMKGTKKPEGPRHIGTALRNCRFQFGAGLWLLDVAPFPPHRRSRLLMRRSRNAAFTIPHPGDPQQPRRARASAAANPPASAG